MTCPKVMFYAVSIFVPYAEPQRFLRDFNFVANLFQGYFLEQISLCKIGIDSNLVVHLLYVSI